MASGNARRDGRQLFSATSLRQDFWKKNERGDPKPNLGGIDDQDNGGDWSEDMLTELLIGSMFMFSASGRIPIDMKRPIEHKAGHCSQIGKTRRAGIPLDATLYTKVDKS